MCNTWTVTALRAAGLPVRLPAVITAGARREPHLHDRDVVVRRQERARGRKIHLVGSRPWGCGSESAAGHPREAGEGRTVNVTSILKIKGRQVATVRPDATIVSIVRALTAKSIGAVIVSEDGVNLLGLVSERDIIQ